MGIEFVPLAPLNWAIVDTETAEILADGFGDKAEAMEAAVGNQPLEYDCNPALEEQARADLEALWHLYHTGEEL